MFQRIRIEALLIAALAATAIQACSNPCTALSDRICECKPNQPEEAACIERVRIAEREKEDTFGGVTEAEELACEAHLDTCDCADLEDGRLAECGLAE